jgi:predicted dehydrogenase
VQLHKVGNAYLSHAAKVHTRLPPGHPEGYLEAFANVYLNFANTIRATVLKDTMSADQPSGDYPTVMVRTAALMRLISAAAAADTAPLIVLQDGRKGMRFVEKVCESGKKGTWVKFDEL